MHAVLRTLLRPLVNYLKRPQVRYSYLPALLDLTTYNRKEQILYTCLEYADLAAVKGDYLEFGVWKGGSITAAYHLSRCFRSLSQMRFYGFDSFQGIPSLTVNRKEGRDFPPGSFSAELEEVRDNLKRAGVNMSRVELVPGWYKDTLTKNTRDALPLRSVAVVNVDCDVYESAVQVLAFIEPYLADGSIVIFDDWYCFANREEFGEQRAFKEWLKKNPHLEATPYKEFGWDGKAFIINRLNARASHQAGNLLPAPDGGTEQTSPL